MIKTTNITVEDVGVCLVITQVDKGQYSFEQAFLILDALNLIRS